MVDYPYHAIGSISLSDPSGRWDETIASEVIPSFPGLESTRITLPGVPGEIPSVLAANVPSTLAIELYVHATVGGILPDAHADRLDALATNVDALYRAIQAASAAYSGGAVVPLKRFYSATKSRTGYGRFEAGSTPVVANGAAYATMTLLFNIPSGSWRDALTTSSEYLPGTNVPLPLLAASTAPIPDSRVVLIGPMTKATVTNAQGYGFTLNLPLADGQWTVVDTANWSYKAPTTGTPSAGATATLTAAITAAGPPLGSALVLTPNATTVPINVVMTGSSGSSKFIVRAMPAYF